MQECHICYEKIEDKKWLPCSHFLCTSCFHKLLDDKCPFCRQPFTEYNKIIIKNDENQDNEPDYWLDYNPVDWVVYSHYKSDGTEIIFTERRTAGNNTWRNDYMTTKVKSRRWKKKRILRSRN